MWVKPEGKSVCILPWRENEGIYSKVFTWLCAVPKCEVSGTLTVGGQTRQVKGSGYHDRQ